MNVLLILSDQHAAAFTGCYGDRITRTEAIDALAGRGARCDAAITPSPLCVPARGAIAGGRYAHELGLWSNDRGWSAERPGWTHHLRAQGVHVATIGKLDYAPGADHGIDEAVFAKHRGQPWRDVALPAWYDDIDVGHLPGDAMPVVPPLDAGELLGTRSPPHRDYFEELCRTAPYDGLHPNDSADAKVAAFARRWLAERRPADRPWLLTVNLWKPHSPWTPHVDAWRHYAERVDLDALDDRYREPLDHLHPWVRAYVEGHATDLVRDELLRRCLIGYHATVEFVDRRVAAILDAVEEQGLLEDTLVVYASDHGEHVGAHRCAGKAQPYDESIRVPLVAAGPGVRAGTVVDRPVSLLDLYPTACEALGREPLDGARGRSLLPLLRGEDDPGREPCALSVCSGMLPGCLFAVRAANAKYVHAVDERPMLFDLAADPLELDDRYRTAPEDPATEALAAPLRAWLETQCDPVAVAAACREANAPTA